MELKVASLDLQQIKEQKCQNMIFIQFSFNSFAKQKVCRVAVFSFSTVTQLFSSKSKAQIGIFVVMTIRLDNFEASFHCQIKNRLKDTRWKMTPRKMCLQLYGIFKCNNTLG